jgi:RimJ/RimL family protein N-acetyltransferase
MARAGRNIVDGRGAERVVEALQSSTTALLVRPATEADSRTIWDWANDPATRAASFSPEPIPWERHVTWFTGKLHDPRCHLYVVTDKDQRPLGMVRYDVEDSEAVVSINLSPACRGRGLGPVALRQSADCLFDKAPVHNVIALIKPENQASVVAFERAGYRSQGQTVVNGCGALRFRLERQEARS